MKLLSDNQVVETAAGRALRHQTGVRQRDWPEPLRRTTPGDDGRHGVNRGEARQAAAQLPHGRVPTRSVTPAKADKRGYGVAIPKA